ncbi:MAG: hypothetical protein KME07_10455 [Pegethrix bostrychoides GSE-TBD4-15B]|uniref:Uncharacterized protein n=1 Tax=Pegethrix bostrychoides GSE-TBD4-15B TaxID=2839662 RepID=A0A951PAV5_9CYAN|nr:hypothetical protein [Pegethrix bostrychoides GSE-TBD4-15B]
MFILKRQDVEIYSIQHPKKDQQVPVLRYQTQNFRLISVFSAAQEEEAKALWRDLTDNRGKACVLLEEPERYSVWGKIRLEQLEESVAPTAGELPACSVQASLLLLQAVYLDIEDMLGARQVAAFRKELFEAFRQHQLPQANLPEAIEQLLVVNPLALVQVPNWQEHQLQGLLQALHRIGKQHFGNANFVERAMESLQELPHQDREAFLKWLKRSQLAERWH